MVRKSSKVSKRNWIIGILVAVIIAMVATGLTTMFSITGDGITKKESNGTVSQDLDGDGQKDNNEYMPNFGESSTVGLNAFTGSWGDQGSETEVNPAYTIFDSTNAKIINDAAANSTSTTVGETLDIYGTGSSYYVDPKLDYLVKTEAPTISDIKAYTIADTTDLVITAYDKEKDALTADDNATNTADYSGGDMVADDEEVFYLKLEQTGTDDVFDLFAICTYAIGAEVDSFEMDLNVESDWVLANKVPEALKDASIALTDDTGASTTEKGYDDCYVRKDGKPLRLTKNQDTGKIKFILDTDDSSAPTANGDSYFGASFMDGSYETDEDGNIFYDFYSHDNSEDPASVGLDESADTTFNSLDVAVAIEAQ